MTKHTIPPEIRKQQRERLEGLRESLEDELEAFLITWGHRNGLRVVAERNRVYDAKMFKVFDKDEAESPTETGCPAFEIELGLSDI